MLVLSDLHKNCCTCLVKKMSQRRNMNRSGGGAMTLIRTFLRYMRDCEITHVSALRILRSLMCVLEKTNMSQLRADISRLLSHLQIVRHNYLF